MATAITRSGVGLVECAEEAALCGLKLSEGQRELAALIEAHHTTVASCGRQSGKTTLAAVTAVWNLLLRPDLDRLAGRSARYVISIANSKEQASILLGFVREFTEHSPMLRKRIEQVREDRIVFAGGRILTAAPCSDRLTRGLRASLFVMDEAAHMVSESWGPRTAERLFAALRPSLVVYGSEAKSIIASTPGSDWFAGMYGKAEAGELPGAVAFTAPTARMNAAVSDEYLAGERALLGEADFAREFMGQIGVAGSGQFFDESDLRPCVGRYVTLEPGDGRDWVLGLDPSFASDPSGLALVGFSREDNRRLVVGLAESWQPRRSRAQRRAAKTEAERREVASVVLDRVAELALRYKAPVVSDSHLAAVVSEELRARGVGKVVITAWSGKLLAQAFSGIRARVLADTISFPDRPDLIAELLRVRTRTRTGTPTVELPRSAQNHCDMASALAAACLHVERKGSRRPARTLSSFGRSYVSPAVKDELLRTASWGMR